MTRLISHIDENLHTRAIAQEFKDVPATRVLREGWEKFLRMEREAAARSHGEAAYIMQDFVATHRPFVLFLRSFEIEASDYLTPENDLGKRMVVTTGSGPSRVERKLLAGLKGRLKTLGVANPAQPMTSRLGFPRLMIPNEGWEPIVQNLVQYAHFIVLDCHTLAPGVMRELEFIRAAGRQQETIIVLPSANDSGQDSLRQFAFDKGALVEMRPHPLKDNAEFTMFPRIASEDEIDFDQLDAATVFSDLLGSAAAVEAPPFDAVSWARGLNNEAVEFSSKQQYVQAIHLHFQALVLRRHIDDRSGILTSLINIGIVNVDTVQFADALEAFLEALPIARELNRPEDESLLIGYISRTRKLQRRSNWARPWRVLVWAFENLWRFTTATVIRLVGFVTRSR